MIYRAFFVIYCSLAVVGNVFPQQAQLLKEINPSPSKGGSLDFSQSNITNNGILYFLANNGSKGLELWRSDGTTTGTFLLKDIVVGSGGLTLANFATLGTKVIIGAVHGSIYEIWISDGTTDGTTLLKSLGTTINTQSRRDGMVTVGNLVFFGAYAQGAGSELWKTDGTVAGTVAVKGINDQIISAPEVLSESNSLLLFYTTAANQGNVLWRSNGEISGTYPVFDIALLNNPGILFNQIITTPTGAFFDGEGDSGVQLWITDGTAGGTKVVKENTGAHFERSYPNYAVLNGKLYFAGTGPKLWVSDGSSDGTYLVKDAYPNDISSINRMQAINGKLYFMINKDGSEQLWVSDGTEQGTQRIPTYKSQSGYTNSKNIPFVGYGNDVFLTGYSNFQWELWKTDGTTASEAFNLSGSVSSEPRDLVVLNDKIIFFATSIANTFSSNNFELYYYLDPTVPAQEPGKINAELAVTPNPAHGYFTVHAPLLSGSSVPLRLLAPDGRMIQQWELNQEKQTFYLPLVPPGIYVLVATKPDGSNLITKIILE